MRFVLSPSLFLIAAPFCLCRMIWSQFDETTVENELAIDFIVVVWRPCCCIFDFSTGSVQQPKTISSPSSDCQLIVQYMDISMSICVALFFPFLVSIPALSLVLLIDSCCFIFVVVVLPTVVGQFSTKGYQMIVFTSQQFFANIIQRIDLMHHAYFLVWNCSFVFSFFCS